MPKKRLPIDLTEKLKWEAEKNDKIIERERIKYEKWLKTKNSTSGEPLTPLQQSIIDKLGEK